MNKSRHWYEILLNIGKIQVLESNGMTLLHLDYLLIIILPHLFLTNFNMTLFLEWSKVFQLLHCSFFIRLRIGFLKSNNLPSELYLIFSFFDFYQENWKKKISKYSHFREIICSFLINCELQSGCGCFSDKLLFFFFPLSVTYTLTINFILY